MSSHERVVVLLSGGQDSTTCLFQALADGAEYVMALSIWYGQRHSAELESALHVVEKAREAYPKATIEHVVQHMDKVLVGSSPLISDNQLGQYDDVEHLPGGVEPTFVPGRNLLFLTLAANRAASVNATAIVTGVCEEDYGGYYDCRQLFIDAAEVAIAQAFNGTDEHIEIITPLMKLSKAETVQLARDLPGCWDALAYSHTCYAGEVPPCGQCHACLLRQRGFDEAEEKDPLLQRVGVIV